MARPKYHKFKGGERCEECGTRQWYAQDALRYCRNGHRLEGFAAHEADEDAFGTHGKVVRKKKEARKKVALKLTGDEGRELYLETLQLILIRQVQWLVDTQAFPLDFTELVRALWALRVRNLPIREHEGIRPGRGDDSDGASTILFSSQSEPDSSDVDLSDATTTTWAPDVRRRWKLPKLIDTLALCYLGCVVRRLPVMTRDFHHWAQKGGLDYLAAFNQIPQNVRDRLPPEFHQALRVQDHIPVGQLQVAVQQAVISYKYNFDMTLPPLNHIPPLIRLVLELSLPGEVYVTAKCIADILRLEFSYPVGGKRIRTMNNPEVLLVALVLVSTKLLYSLDGIERRPLNRDDLRRTNVNWAEWQKATADAPAEQRQHLVRGAEYKITTDDALVMDNTKLDDYMDWFESMWLGQGEPRTTEKIRELFGKQKKHEQNIHQGLDDEYTDRIKERYQTLNQSLTPIEPVAFDTSENERTQPRNLCPVWRLEEDLPDVAKSLYQKAASLAALPLATLLRGATQVEKQLEYWCRQRMREKGKGKETARR
ncbi:hypothetical protein GGR57DRAFT_512730 [Xylariaceae sp. FL1272]|nr:hypothetical protein GGR57DRAFT_512730 [Xylariaceae sp. FL1272]